MPEVRQACGARMPVEIRRTCQFCGERFESGIPSCECCQACGGTPDGDWSCEECMDARDAAEAAAHKVWEDHLKQTEGGVQ